MSEQSLEDLFALLSAPFEEREIEFKPQYVSGNRALAVPYVDARTVMDRLDRVLGLGGWQTSYDLVDGGVVCRLRILVGGGWIEHQDVGSPSEQPDDGDKLKAAFSDALKRVAVHVGVSRYLYRLQPQWVGYDPQKKRLTEIPRLPAWALPSPRPTASGEKVSPPPVQGSAARVTASPAGDQPARQGKALPANGPELRKRLYDHDERLSKQGLCKDGELIGHVVDAGVKAGHEPDLSAWTGPAIRLAVEVTKAFEAKAKADRARKHEAVRNYLGMLGWDEGRRKAWLRQGYGVDSLERLAAWDAQGAVAQLRQALSEAQVGGVPPDPVEEAEREAIRAEGARKTAEEVS